MDLIKGYKKFYHKYFVLKPAIYKELSTEGQRPHTLVIACSDSRIDPAIVTKAAPGEIFVVRNVAALVPEYTNDESHHGTGAAIEFSVCGLGVNHIVVLGHSQCGGIKALVDEEIGNQFPMVQRWVSFLKPLIDAEKSKPMKKDVDFRCEQASIKASLENLMSYPFVAERVEKGQLTLHGWHLDIETGELYDYKAKKGKFEALTI